MNDRRTVRLHWPARSLLCAGLLAALGFLSPSAARADLIFQVNTKFNGDTPTSTTPWLTADFKTLSTGTVQLTLTSHLNVASEFISDVDFNVNPNYVPSALTIVQSPVANPIPTAITHTTQNKQNLTGGGAAGKGFDIALSWATSTGVGRFDGTDSVVFLITASGLTASDFNYTNTGSAAAAIGAHIQGIPVQGGGTTSGAVKNGLQATPEPSTFALAGFGAVGLLGYGLRRRGRLSA